jgi:hypothetical protein
MVHQSVIRSRLLLLYLILFSYFLVLVCSYDQSLHRKGLFLLQPISYYLNIDFCHALGLLYDSCCDYLCEPRKLDCITTESNVRRTFHI